MCIRNVYDPRVTVSLTKLGMVVVVVTSAKAELCCTAEDISWSHSVRSTRFTDTRDGVLFLSTKKFLFILQTVTREEGGVTL